MNIGYWILNIDNKNLWWYGGRVWILEEDQFSGTFITIPQIDSPKKDWQQKTMAVDYEYWRRIYNHPQNRFPKTDWQK